MIWRVRNLEFDLANSVKIMGVLNVTPDSFSDGGKFFDTESAVERAAELEGEGADILDIGAASSRPGAGDIPAEVELERILPVLEEVRSRVRIPVSIDTTSSVTARKCLQLGAAIINDISGLKRDGALAETVAEFGAGLVLMHMRGTPQNMQEFTDYDDTLGDIADELGESARRAEEAGVGFENIAVDPGIGFSKTAEQNLEIIAKLERLKVLGRPILIGTSRKSFIGKVTGKGVSERLFGTAASVALSVFNGAGIVRVHDVAEMKDVVRVAEKAAKTSQKCSVK